MKHKLLGKLKIGIAIGLVVAALGLAILITPVFGNKVLIVRSGSMAPSLPVGSLVIIRPREPIVSPLPAVPLYSPGDIISFKDTPSPKTITSHRIVSYKIEGGLVTYQTKGDANNDVDKSLIIEKNILGNVRFAIPFAGILFAFTKTKIGFLILVLIPALMVILIESWNIFKEVRKKRPLRYTYLKNFRISQNPTLTSLVPLLAVGLVFAQTSAYFSDTATSTNNVFAAAESFTNHLVISEVQIDGGVGTELNNHDFVELYNPTSGPINMSGITLVKRTSGSTADTTLFPFTGSDIVPAHGYFLWANSANGFANSIGADESSNGILSGNNSVALRNGPLDTGTIIDALSWDLSVNSLKEGTEFSPDPIANQSMERKAISTSTASSMNGGVDDLKGNGYDTDNNATDFVLRTVSQPQNSTTGGTESP